MIYKTKNIDPQRVLASAGYYKAPDRGWHRVTKKATMPKKGKYAYKPLIPRERFHALIYENEISLHKDVPKKKLARSHRAISYSPIILREITRIKQFDLSYENES